MAMTKLVVISFRTEDGFWAANVYEAPAHFARKDEPDLDGILHRVDNALTQNSVIHRAIGWANLQGKGYEVWEE